MNAWRIIRQRLRRVTFVEAVSVIGIGACVALIAHAFGYEFFKCDCPANTLTWFSAMLSAAGISFFLLQFVTQTSVDFWGKARDSMRVGAVMVSLALIGAMVINESWCELCLVVHACVALIFLQTVIHQSSRVRVLTAAILILVAVLLVQVDSDRPTKLALQEQLSRLQFGAVRMARTAAYQGLPTGTVVQTSNDVPRNGTLIFWPVDCSECQRSSLMNALQRSRPPVYVLALKDDSTIRQYLGQSATFKIGTPALFKSFLVPLRGVPIVYELQSGTVKLASAL